MLVTLNAILPKAQSEHYAVGLFNTTDTDILEAAISAAEELLSPIIIGTAEVLLPYGELSLIAPSIIYAAKKASVPVCVHYDHGLTFERCIEAMKLGFSSVMFDGSVHKYKENAEMTIEEKEKKEEKNDEEKKEQKKDEEKKEEDQKDKNKKEIIKPELKENKDFLDYFKSDMPFQIYIRKDSSGYYYNRETISLFDSKNFPLYNKKLKDYLDIKKFSTPFDVSNIRLNNYELIVKFNQQSKYINKDIFDLNTNEKTQKS